MTVYKQRDSVSSVRSLQEDDPGGHLDPVQVQVLLRAEAFPAEPAGGRPHPAVLPQLQGVREAKTGSERSGQPQPQDQVRAGRHMSPTSVCAVEIYA